MDKKEVIKKDYKELKEREYDRSGLGNDKLKKEIKKNTSSVVDSQSEIQIIKEINNKSKKTYDIKKKNSTKLNNSASESKKEAYVNQKNKLEDSKKVKKSTTIKANKTNNKTIVDSKLDKEIINNKNNKNNKSNDEKDYNSKSDINKSANVQNNSSIDEKIKRIKQNINNRINDNKKETLYDDKVTDFKDVQKAAIANEKKKRKQEKINCIKERIEQLKSPKAKAIITGILLLIAFLTFSALTIINDVQVDEGKHYTEDEIKKFVIKSIFDYNSVFLFLKYRYSEQESIPFVEYIDVDWIDKNTVRLKVYDKNIIGCTNFMNEYVYFDKDGYVVETSSKKEDNIPYITGINFEELTLNSKIKVDDDKIFEIILTITQQVSKYKLDIDEINFDNNYSLTMYAGDITVLLGKQATYDEQLAKLKSMLEKARMEKLSGILHMEKYKEGQDRIIFDKK